MNGKIMAVIEMNDQERSGNMDQRPCEQELFYRSLEKVLFNNASLRGHYLDFKMWELLIRYSP